MNIFSDTFTISKRLLGILMSLGGIAGIAGLFLLDALRNSEDAMIGPAQQLAFVVLIAVVIIGISLIPLGKRPA